ncbi:PPE domain-containing protein [Streptomyces glaucosporus]|uniref:PPE domain-containing protein n=1 Tax=Streptomyces glaucosporus TaxID=284044 RepID=A0ABP5VP66_9ACTN
MKLDALRFADFSKLDTAIGDWSEMITKLQSLKEDADSRLKGKADKADWTGYNAAVTREFIAKTAHEFADAHTQATSIRNILRDARDELVDYRRQLNDAIERGLKKNLTVRSNPDGGFTVTMNIHPDRAAKGTEVPDHSPQDAENLRDEIQNILTKAAESDSTAARALKALADQSPHGFSDASYKDRDAAAEALKAADRAAKLADRPEDMSPEEFDELNRLLKEHNGDSLFAEQFATALGPKGVLEFWAGLNDPHLNMELGQARVKQYGDLQEHLGLTLATATQSDSAGMQRWERDMVNLGGEFVPDKNNPRAMGVQVMSNLMRWGDFDDKFLTSYGNELMRLEKERSGNGRNAAAAWLQFPTDPMLNRTGTDGGSDPMTGYMMALSRSPEAATEFFSGTFVTKDEDHDFLRDTDGDGNKGKVGLTNFQYLFEERDWPKEHDSEMKESVTGQNALGWALEAAATGHPAGQQPTPDLPPHSPEQARLVEQIVNSVSDDSERLTKRGYLSDSLGQIAAEYLPDINRAMADDKHGNTDLLFPVAGTAAELDHNDVTRFLVSVGQNPEGYAKVEMGQKAYMTNLMDYHLNPELPEDKRYPQDPQTTIEDIARRSGEVSGTLAIGRQEAVLGEAHQKDEDYQKSMGQVKNIISGTIGTGIGVGTSFIATPAGGAAAGGAAGTVSSVVLEQIFGNLEPNNLKDAGKNEGVRWEMARQNSTEHGQVAALEAAKAHDLPYRNRVADWVLKGNEIGFANASVNVSRMADDLDTNIPN